MVKVIGLIPARGGSTRVERKNIRDLNGDPLIAWTINDLLDASMIDDVYVSTDDENIKKISLDYGAKVIDRPDNISGEHEQLEPAITHTLKEIKDRISIIGIFQCTTPFRRVSVINYGIRKMISTNADSLIYMCEFDRFLWTREPKPINYDYTNRIRSQDKKWELIEYGDYLCKPSTLEIYNNRIGGHIEYYIGDKLSYFDIDTEIDLKIANGIARGLDLYATN